MNRKVVAKVQHDDVRINLIQDRILEGLNDAILKYQEWDVPAFFFYMKADQSIPDQAYTRVLLDTADIDTNETFKAPSNAFYPTVPGFYDVKIKGYLRPTLGNNTVYGIYLYKNGSPLAVATAYGPGGANISNQLSEIVQMNGTTDYLQLYVWHNNGSASPLAGQRFYTCLTGHFVRPLQ